MPEASEELWIRRLLDVGRAVMSELDLAAVPDRLLRVCLFFGGSGLV